MFKSIIKNIFKDCLNEYNEYYLSDSFKLLSYYDLKLLPSKEKRNYILNSINFGYLISPKEFELLCQTARRDCAVALLIRRNDIESYHYELLSEKHKKEYLYVKKMLNLFANNKKSLEKFKNFIIKKYNLNIF